MRITCIERECSVYTQNAADGMIFINDDHNRSFNPDNLFWKESAFKHIESIKYVKLSSSKFSIFVITTIEISMN